MLHAKWKLCCACCRPNGHPGTHSRRGSQQKSRQQSRSQLRQARPQLQQAGPQPRQARPQLQSARPLLRQSSPNCDRQDPAAASKLQWKDGLAASTHYKKHPALFTLQMAHLCLVCPRCISRRKHSVGVILCLASCCLCTLYQQMQASTLQWWRCIWHMAVLSMLAVSWD